MRQRRLLPHAHLWVDAVVIIRAQVCFICLNSDKGWILTAQENMDFAPYILHLQKDDLIFIYLLQCDLTLHENVYCSCCNSGTNVRQILCILTLGVRLPVMPLSPRDMFQHSASVERWNSGQFGCFQLTGGQKRNFSLLISLEPLEDITFTFPWTSNVFFSKPSC